MTHKVLAVVLLLTLGRVTAPAQVLGTYSWQTQPYCNVVSLRVEQFGGVFQLTGTDNLCGAGTAPVTGTGVLSGGNVAFGVAINLPTGRVAHISATIDIGTLAGPWSDADGNSGTFVFSGNAPGAPRPAPTAANAIQVTQFSPTVYAGTGSAATVSRSDHDHDARYYTRAQVDARFAQTVDLQFSSVNFAASLDQVVHTNGCVRQNAAPYDLRAGVQLPRGATITSITGYLLDGTGESTLSLIRVAAFTTVIATVTSGTTSTLTTRTVNLTVPEVVEANEYFALEFNAPDATHQVCGVGIRYTMP